MALQPPGTLDELLEQFGSLLRQLTHSRLLLPLQQVLSGLEEWWKLSGLLLSEVATDEGNKLTPNAVSVDPLKTLYEWNRERKGHFFPIFLWEVVVTPGADCSPLIAAFET